MRTLLLSASVAPAWWCEPFFSCVHWSCVSFGDVWRWRWRHALPMHYFWACSREGVCACVRASPRLCMCVFVYCLRFSACEFSAECGAAVVVRALSVVGLPTNVCWPLVFSPPCSSVKSWLFLEYGAVRLLHNKYMYKSCNNF